MAIKWPKTVFKFRIEKCELVEQFRRRTDTISDMTRPNQVILDELNGLVVDAYRAGREPVKIDFTDEDKAEIKRFFEQWKRRGTSRRESFLWLCDLLGERLHPSNWERLYACVKVSGTDGLDFLVGGHKIRENREKTDWTNKILGLKRVAPGVFVVGVNQIYYDHANSLSSSVKMEKPGN